MKSLKKIITVILALSMLLCALALASCGGGEETPDSQCTEHEDSDSNGRCDICDAELEAAECTHTDGDDDGFCDECFAKMPVLTYAYTITVKSESGEGVPNVQIQLSVKGDVKDTKTTDAQGKVSGAIEAGKYTLIVENLPENWYTVSNYSEITIEKKNNAIDIEAIDNTPNGTQEKPFPAENAETGEPASIAFPAGASYIFTAKGTSRYLVINNENAKVTYEDVEYTAKDGTVKVLLKESVSTNAPIFFTVTNTGSEEATITLAFETVPGTMNNPFNAVLDTETTASIVDGEIVYYKWTATRDCFLVASSTTVGKDITLYNRSTFISSQEAEGGVSSYLYVGKGDIIDIKVSLEGEASGAVVFTLGEYSGQEDSALPLLGNAALAFEEGEGYYFVYTGEDAEIIIYNEYGDYLEVKINGQAIELDEGECFTTITNGAIIYVLNTADQMSDIVFEILIPDKLEVTE